MRVRRAELQDLSDLAKLFDHYRQFYKQTSDLAAARVFLSERLVQKDAVIFVGSPDASGSLIGFAQMYPSFSSVGLKRLWILNDLFVTHEARQLGAAKKMIEACVQFASQEGARGLTLKTAVDNITAQKLYESSGWKRDDKFLTYNFMF